MISTHTISKSPRRAPPVLLDARSIAGRTVAMAKPVAPATPADPKRRVRVLGEVAPQHRLLRGPVTTPLSTDEPSPDSESRLGQRFVSNMEVLDALLAGAHDRLISRLSRLGLRRAQAQRFVVAATGRLLRGARSASDFTDARLAAEAAKRVCLSELAARTRVSGEQAERALQVVLSELASVLADTSR